MDYKIVYPDDQPVDRVEIYRMNTKVERYEMENVVEALIKLVKDIENLEDCREECDVLNIVRRKLLDRYFKQCEVSKKQ